MQRLQALTSLFTKLAGCLYIPHGMRRAKYLPGGEVTFAVPLVYLYLQLGALLTQNKSLNIILIAKNYSSLVLQYLHSTI